MRPYLSLALVLFAGCTEDEDALSTQDAEYTVEVVGRFAPPDASGLWIGVESVRITDREGYVVCEDTVEIGVPAILPTEHRMTLDMAFAELREVAGSCSLEFGSAQGATSRGRYLRFEPDPGQFDGERGLVSTSDDLATWDGFATGLLIDGEIVYHHAYGLDANEL